MTELTIIQTGEVVEQMTTVEAERITSRIADKLDAIADNLEQVLPLIGEALTREAWKVLGYTSPTEYVSERFAGALTRLSPEVRRPVVAQLSEAGMSTRTIAPLVGVSPRQAAYDRGAGVKSLHTSPTSPDSPAKESSVHPARTSPLPTSDRIVGADNKSYPRPEPKEAPEPTKPRRRPITDQFFDAAYDFRKNVERLDKLIADDRFPKNKEQIALSHKNDLLRLADVLQHVLRELD